MNYIVVVLVLVVGLFIVLTSKNLIKKIIGLGIFQTSILLFYLSLGKIYGGKPPIIGIMQVTAGTQSEVFANPVPQVLMLTAIVVGIATLAVAMSFIIKIKLSFGTIEEDKIIKKLRTNEFSS